jgi:hypothetical protein
VQDNIKGGATEPTDYFHGDVGPHAFVALQSGNADQSLYCVVRRSEGLSAAGSQLENVEEMLAAAQKSPGFRGAYFARSADNTTRGIGVLFCDTRDHATAVHVATLAISRKNWPNITVRVVASGETIVLAMA